MTEEQRSQLMLSMFHSLEEDNYSEISDLWLAHRLSRHLRKGGKIDAVDSRKDHPHDTFRIIHYAAYYGLRHVYSVAKKANADLNATTNNACIETAFQIVLKRREENKDSVLLKRVYDHLISQMLADGANVKKEYESEHFAHDIISTPYSQLDKEPVQITHHCKTRLLSRFWDWQNG